MTGQLDGTDRARLARTGLVGMSSAEALSLLTEALRLGAPVLVPALLDTARLVGQEVPKVLRRLVPASRPVVASVAVRDQLRGLPADEQERVLLNVVAREVIGVLGHGSTTVAPERAFRELGFDSLTALELRNRMNAITGLVLPATSVFDHPTPVALAREVRRQLTGERPPAAAREQEVRELLSAIPVRRLAESGLLDRLLALVPGRHVPVLPGDPAGDDGDVETMDAAALVRLARGDDG
jgi:hypothetical protein